MFSLVRHVRRPFWKELLDLLFAGYIFTTAQDIKDTVDGLFFLIASDEAGTIYQVKHETITLRLAVPDWQPALKISFKRVVIDGYRYRMARRLL